MARRQQTCISYVSGGCKFKIEVLVDAVSSETTSRLMSLGLPAVFSGSGEGEGALGVFWSLVRASPPHKDSVRMA